MTGFHITFNNQQISAGLEQGVTTVIFTRVKNADRDELTLDIGGLDTNERRHTRWLHNDALQVGDEISIKVTRLDNVSEYTTFNEYSPEDEKQRMLQTYLDLKERLEKEGLI